MPPSSEPNTPLLIGLPHGLDLGGVTTWAVRLANGMAERGRQVALIVHPRGEGQPAARIDLDPRVLRVEPPDWPSMHHLEGDLSPFLPTYRDTLRTLHRRTGSPVAYMPNILGDSYGIGAALSLADFDTIRMIGWQHTDTEYDTGLLLRFEPIISRYVAIDERAIDTLAARMPHRRPDFAAIRHGVPIPSTPPAPREPLADRPIRLIYTGRMEHLQKRILCYPHLADELTRRGIDHEIILVGDGPAASELDTMLATRPSVIRKPLATLAEIESWLKRSDAFVLGSRFEGLCISRIEAMAHGCVPLVTHVNSGAATGINPGISGELVHAQPADDEITTARALADAVERLLSKDLNQMGRAAWVAASEHFGLDVHVKSVCGLIDAAAASPPRPWRASWPCAFSFSPNAPGCSGSVPSHGPQRLRRKLAELQGRRIALHGAGRHTIELAGVLSESPAAIVAITDDDRGRWERPFLGWKIWPPATVAASGATDVIISSWLHAESIWKRREVYERQGLTVHQLYEP